MFLANPWFHNKDESLVEFEGNCGPGSSACVHLLNQGALWGTASQDDARIPAAAAIEP